MSLPAMTEEDLIYPETDGRPMGEGTLQIQWIMALYAGFQTLFSSRPDVLVAADLFWYPVEGKRKVVTAPDVMVAFGRPNGHRRSYRQWREDDTPPQVVIEIQSPSNSPKVPGRLFRFYRKYGVEEYYLYNPDTHELFAWRRDGKKLVPVSPVDGYVSPRLGVRFEVPGTEPMRVIGPDGQPFPTLQEARKQAQAEKARADAEAARADAERQRAEAEAARAAAAEQRAVAERQRAEAAEERSQAFAARLRALGLDPDAG